MCRGNDSLSHLMFADDLMILLRGLKIHNMLKLHVWRMATGMDVCRYQTLIHHVIMDPMDSNIYTCTVYTQELP